MEGIAIVVKIVAVVVDKNLGGLDTMPTRPNTPTKKGAQRGGVEAGATVPMISKFWISHELFTFF